MPRAVTVMMALMTMVGVGRAADRQWQTGTWGEVGSKRQLVDVGPGSSGFGPPGTTPAVRAMANVRIYVIETADVRLELQDTVPAGRRSLEVTPGARATFALDKTTVYVREANGAEHRLRLMKRIPKAGSAPTPAVTYSALGGGHLVRSVAEDGRYVTLEDGSVWEIEAGAQFKTIQWQAQANITVRTAPGNPGFDYELINTEDDEGAQAKYIPRR